jgi:hypothetical protein
MFTRALLGVALLLMLGAGSLPVSSSVYAESEFRHLLDRLRPGGPIYYYAPRYYYPPQQY